MHIAFSSIAVPIPITPEWRLNRVRMEVVTKVEIDTTTPNITPVNRSLHMSAFLTQNFG